MKVTSVFSSFCIILPLTVARISLPELKQENESHDLRSLKAQDLGHWHNKIVMQVHDRIREESPTDSDVYERIMAEEISTLCPIDDNECKKSVLQYIDENRARVPDFLTKGHSYELHADFPTNFNSEMKDHLMNIYYSIYLLDHNDVGDVLKTISVISEDAQSSELSEIDKTIVESIASIAMGSTELWTEAHKNKENAFHQLHDNNRRKLQGEGKMVLISLTTSPVQFILADIWGAIRSAIIPSIMVVFQLNTIIGLMRTVLSRSVTDSLYAAGIYVPSKFDYAKCILVKITDLKECNRTTLFGPYFDYSRFPCPSSEKQDEDEDPTV